MQDLLQKWAEDPVDAFADQFEPSFFLTNLMPSYAPILRAMLNLQQKTKERVNKILRDKGEAGPQG